MILLLLLAQITASNAGQLQQSASANDAKSAILCVAFNPKGNLLASGEVDKKIRIYDAATGKQTALLEGHTKQVAAVAFTPDGATLVSAGYDHTIRVWDVASGKQKEIQAGTPKDGEVPDVDDMRAEFSPSTSFLAYGAYQAVWDLRTRKRTSRNDLIVHGWSDFSSDGATLLSVVVADPKSQQFGAFESWNVTAWKKVASWKGTPGASYERVALSPDGARAAAIDVSGDDNKWKIEIWNVADQKLSATGGVLTDTVNGMLFTKDGGALVTAAATTLKLWDAKTGQELASYPVPGVLMGLARSSDGAKLATADAKGGVQVWSLK